MILLIYIAVIPLKKVFFRDHTMEIKSCRFFCVIPVIAPRIGPLRLWKINVVANFPTKYFFEKNFRVCYFHFKYLPITLNVKWLAS